MRVLLVVIGAWRRGSECLGREVQAIGRSDGEFCQASPFSSWGGGDGGSSLFHVLMRSV